LFKLVIKDKFCKYNSTMYSIIHYLIKIITDERYKESLNKFKQITLLDKSINSLFDTNETFEIKL
jgi:response regulator of citrate/malate metabolism